MTNIPRSAVEEKRAEVAAQIKDLDERIEDLGQKRRDLATRLDVFNELLALTEFVHVEPGEARESSSAGRGRPPMPLEMERRRDVLVAVLRDIPSHTATPRALESAVRILNPPCFSPPETAYGKIRSVLYRYEPDYFEQLNRTQGWRLREEYRASPGNGGQPANNTGGATGNAPAMTMPGATAE